MAGRPPAGGPRGTAALVLVLLAGAAAPPAAAAVADPLPNSSANSSAVQVHIGGRFAVLAAAGGENATTAVGPPAAGEPLTLTSCKVTNWTADGQPSALECDIGVRFEAVEVEGPLPVFSKGWDLNLVFAGCCVIVAACAAGMTLGFTSLDPFQMEVLSNIEPEDLEETSAEGDSSASDEPAVGVVKLLEDQRSAERILPVISGHYFGSGKASCGSCMGCPKVLNPTNEHYLLVTLLLMNAAANEALPIFLDRLVPTWIAVLTSVTVVLVFGEIIPSAIFTGPSQLQLAATMVPVVRVARVLTLPIVWPLSLMLDKCLGHEEEEHHRHEVKAMIRTLRRECLEDEEANILQGVLGMHRKTAKDIGFGLETAKKLAHDAVIDSACMKELLRWGHSRILVYNRDASDPDMQNDIRSVLLVKKLLGVNLGRGMRVDEAEHALKQPAVLGASDNLLSVLMQFQKAQCHLAVVSDDPKAVSSALSNGHPIPHQFRPETFCSFEDVMEAMLMAPIFDEDDVDLGRHLQLPELGRSRRTLVTPSFSSSRRITSQLVRRYARQRSSLSVTSSDPEA